MKTVTPFTSLIGGLVIAAAVQSAAATTIQFEDTAPAGQIVFGSISSYFEAGYKIGGLNSSITYGFGSPGASNIEQYGPLSDSTFFGFDGRALSPTIARFDGGIFTLHSLDLGIGTYLGATSGTFTLIGWHIITPLVSRGYAYEITIADHEWHTLSLEGNPIFENIDWVSIELRNAAVGALDNIQVSQVPIPAAGWLFATAAMGLGAVKRRHNRR